MDTIRHSRSSYTKKIDNKYYLVPECVSARYTSLVEGCKMSISRNLLEANYLLFL